MGFKVVCSEDERVDTDQFDLLIHKAQGELLANHAQYNALIFAFCGHGDEDSIFLSDGTCRNRTDVHKEFDGKRCKRFRGKLKLFIFDACQGGAMAPKKTQTNLLGARGGPEDVHVDGNTIILNANTPGYKSYEQQDEGGALIRSFSNAWRSIQGRQDWDKMAKKIARGMVSLTGSRQAMDKREFGVLDDIYFTKPVAVDLSRVQGLAQAQSLESDRTVYLWAMDTKRQTSPEDVLIVTVLEKRTKKQWRREYAANAFAPKTLDAVKKTIDAKYSGRWKMPKPGLSLKGRVGGIALVLNPINTKSQKSKEDE